MAQVTGEINLEYELVSRLGTRRVIRDSGGMEVGWFEPGRRLSEITIEWNGEAWNATRQGNRWTIADVGEVIYRPLPSLATLSLRLIATGPGTEVRFRGSAATAIVEAARTAVGRPAWSGTGVGTGGANLSVVNRFRKPARVSMTPGAVDIRLLLSLAMIASGLRSTD